MHAALGNLDAAIEWLELGITERHYYARPDLIEFAPMRAHPRYAALLRRSTR